VYFIPLIEEEGVFFLRKGYTQIFYLGGKHIMNDTINLDELDEETKSIFLMMMNATICWKKKGMDKKSFLDFAQGSWETLELNGDKFETIVKNYTFKTVHDFFKE